MDNGKFIDICKNEVVKYTNDHLDKTDGKQISSDDVYVVWLTKVLQSNKALLSTTLFDGMYYELTYNGDKNELYIRRLAIAAFFMPFFLLAGQKEQLSKTGSQAGKCEVKTYGKRKSSN